METTELKKGLLAVSEVEPVETLMSGLLARSQEPPKEGDIIEGTGIPLHLRCSGQETHVAARPDFY